MFAVDLRDNLKSYPEFGEALSKKFGSMELGSIPEPYRTSICFLKSILVKIAIKSGWVLENLGIYAYENKDGSKWLTSTVFCNLTEGEIDESLFISDIIQVIETKMSYYSYADSLKDKIVQDDLKSIVDYRENISKS